MRRIYVSTGILQNAIKFAEEGQLEALAFCVQAKRIYEQGYLRSPRSPQIFSLWVVHNGIIWIYKIIKYLHQLQHEIWEAGTELKIEL